MGPERFLGGAFSRTFIYLAILGDLRFVHSKFTIVIHHCDYAKISRQRRIAIKISHKIV